MLRNGIAHAGGDHDTDQVGINLLAEIAERTGEHDAARRWLMRLLVVDQTVVDPDRAPGGATFKIGRAHV